MNMHGPAVDDRPAARHAATDRHWKIRRRHGPILRHPLVIFTEHAEDHRVVGVAQPRSIFRHRVQYRLDVGRRAGNNTEDFTGSSLLLQRFLKFLEQTDIFNRDHSLIGEGFQQSDLLFCKRTEFKSAKVDDTHRSAFAYQWNSQNRSVPCADAARGVDNRGIFRLGDKSDVLNMHDRPVNHCSARRGLAVYGSLDGNITELDVLKKEADSAKSLYEVLLQKIKETDIAASIRSNNVTVVDRATPPASPVRPQKRRIALVGLALGLLAGLATVLVRDYLDRYGQPVADEEAPRAYTRRWRIESAPLAGAGTVAIRVEVAPYTEDDTAPDPRGTVRLATLHTRTAP